MPCIHERGKDIGIDFRLPVTLVVFYHYIIQKFQLVLVETYLRSVIFQFLNKDAV